MPKYPGYHIQKLLPRGEGKQVEIVCNILAGGIPEGENVRLYPGGNELKIRSSETRDRMILLRIKGIPRAALVPGAVIVSSDLPVDEEKEALFYHDGGFVPGETEAVRGGLCDDFNREKLIGRGSFHREGSFLSVRFPDRYPMVPGMQCSILRSDGVPRKFTLLWPGRPDKDQMRRLEASAARRADPNPKTEDVFRRILMTRGFVRIPPSLSNFEDEEFQRIGTWMVRRSVSEILERKVLKLTTRPGGADSRVLRITDYPHLLIHAIADFMATEGRLIRRKGWYYPPGPPPLSPFHRGWLAKVQGEGEEGLRVSSLRNTADKEALVVLGRSGLVRGGQDLWLSPEVCEELSKRLLSGMSPGGKLNMADARGKLGGNRVRTIELLAILEEDGKLAISPQGDERTIL